MKQQLQQIIESLESAKAKAGTIQNGRRVDGVSPEEVQEAIDSLKKLATEADDQPTPPAANTDGEGSGKDA